MTLIKTFRPKVCLINPKVPWLTHLKPDAPIFPWNSLKYHLGSWSFLCTILDAQNHVTEALICSSSQSPPRSILLIPRDYKSHILGPWGPHQSPETAQNSCLTAAFLLTLQVMVKTLLQWLQCISKPTSSQKFVSSSSRDCKASIWASWEPIKAQKPPKIGFDPAFFPQ